MPLPDATTLWFFAGACMAIYASPGPDTLYLASRAAAASAAGGRPIRDGMLSGLGICLGVQIHLAATVLGLAALVVQWPIVLTVIQWTGAAYLAYLGIRILMARSGSEEASVSPLPPASSWQIVRDGLFVNLLNPKMPAFFLAFLPQFVDPQAGSAAVQLLLFGSLFALGGMVWTVIQAIAFGTLGGWVAQRHSVRVAIKWISGTVLIGLAANLALQQK